MKVIKAKRTRAGNFLTVSKHILTDKRISFRARGLFLTVMSLPPTWNYSIIGLAALHPGGTDQIRKILKELREFGYVAIKAKREERRIVEWIYYFDEFGEATSVFPESTEVAKKPVNPVLPENELLESQDVDVQEEEISTQLKTNSLIENEVILNGAASPPVELTISDEENIDRWDKAMDCLRQNLNEIAYRDWFSLVRFKGVDSDGRPRLIANEVTKKWIEKTYKHPLDQVLDHVGFTKPVVWELENAG